ncbi:hypothetical protein P171DRAFT_418037 [Karstenula rhodostoma CBS 690.94]|uniref:DUF7580 domain-containing protein n=1 Tax=Karstenula rhodostoma CBS 690.94 TaxID=1392251 RepID=A0A9P4PCK6_9PLEO|nr:hypothetical protein P171DRAFT_418037 [Karstenula rhodostoma CBS 690.94]
MSGLEIAGVLLGAFPLLISGIEHWHNVAKAGGYFWRVRKEYNKCRRDVNYHEILYKRNLRALLAPVVIEAEEVKQLMDNPGGDGWKNVDLQARLELRLQESYRTYMEILTLPNGTTQRSPSPGKLARTVVAKAAFDYQMFRVKFSLRETIREGLFAQLQECNDRLEKLLVTSSRIPDVQSSQPASSKQIYAIDNALKVAHRKSAALFKAIEVAWNCSCLRYHLANLRLEHRTLSEAYFEIILMSMAPTSNAQHSWSWRELQCGYMKACTSQAANGASTRQRSAKSNLHTVPVSYSRIRTTCLILILDNTDRMYLQAISAISGRPKKVGFAANVTSTTPAIVIEPQIDPSIQLCQLLRDSKCMNCMGVIGHDNQVYHLHPLTARRERNPKSSLTLDQILSPDHIDKLSRRQRYATALVLASSVAQLQSTPWLRAELNKQDVLFFPNADDGNINSNEPFIQQGFSSGGDIHADAVERNFFSLGILLLELCFGRRLEDEPLRKKQPMGDDAATKRAFDLMADLQARGVSDEGGLDYDVAVKWCFTPGRDLSKGWRTDLIKNVINPLEECQRQFKAIANI